MRDFWLALSALLVTFAVVVHASDDPAWGKSSFYLLATGVGCTGFAVSCREKEPR